MENDNQNSEIVGLILAAGYSSRMGAFKPLLQIGNMTAVERIAENMKRAGFHRIVGVTGITGIFCGPYWKAMTSVKRLTTNLQKGCSLLCKEGLNMRFRNLQKGLKVFF